MKQFFILALILGFTSIQPTSVRAVNTVKVVEKELKDKQNITTEDSFHFKLNKKEEVYNKSTLKERIALLFVKNRVKKNANKSTKKRYINGFAIAGFVLGILGTLLFPGLGFLAFLGLFFSGMDFLISLGFLFSIISIVFSLIALRRIKYSHGMTGGKKMAIIGLVLGILGVSPLVIFSIASLFN